MSETNEQDLTTEEVAKPLRLHKATVQRLLLSKRLLGYKLGRNWRIPVSALKNFQQDTICAMGMLPSSHELQGNTALVNAQTSPIRPEDLVGKASKNSHISKRDKEFWQMLKEIRQLTKEIRPVPLDATRHKHLYENSY